uniref:VPS37 C-terminal domain-containing protein n=1 Tax=Hemiselmis andersenii TaxID=464988 RepID=A0A6U4IUQ9_HEMAN|eukprot:CAMPEP_0171996260 /NCGR_PEP_ID=MMETSP1041-20130122/23_1 /TAXON_ID=464988 /ORGANISM="Hemiselmis andersenii, Strain CCMP439" /LENGTH=171 /DNA_ID=CAMNT_0012649385 /DNA_START=6 /DNA_END=521 /DNA_ORIENTATION=-
MSLSSQSHVHAHKLEPILRDMGAAELRALMESEKNLSLFFENNVKLVRERGSLIDEVKVVNVNLARSNIAEAEKLALLEQEVAQVRARVRGKQESLKPQEKEIQALQQRDTIDGVRERLRAEIGDVERATREIMDGEGQAEGWVGGLQGCLEARERLHLKQELLERMQGGK